MLQYYSDDFLVMTKQMLLCI